MAETLLDALNNETIDNLCNMFSFDFLKQQRVYFKFLTYRSMDLLQLMESIFIESH